MVGCRNDISAVQTIGLAGRDKRTAGEGELAWYNEGLVLCFKAARVTGTHAPSKVTLHLNSESLCPVMMMQQIVFLAELTTSNF